MAAHFDPNVFVNDCDQSVFVYRIPFYGVRVLSLILSLSYFTTLIARGQCDIFACLLRSVIRLCYMMNLKDTLPGGFDTCDTMGRKERKLVTLAIMHARRAAFVTSKSSIWG